MDHETPGPRYLAVGIQDGGSRCGQIRVPIRVPVLFGLGHTPGRTPYQAYRDPHDETLPCVAPHLHLQNRVGSRGMTKAAAAR